MTVVNKSNHRNNDRERVYINWAIKAFNILILWENWEQLWTVSRKEALEKYELIKKEKWLIEALKYS